MGELRKVQLRLRMILDDWDFSDFFETVKDTTVRIYALTFAKQIPKRTRTPTSAGFSFLMQNVSPSLLPV